MALWVCFLTRLNAIHKIIGLIDVNWCFWWYSLFFYETAEEANKYIDVCYKNIVFSPTFCLLAVFIFIQLTFRSHTEIDSLTRIMNMVHNTIHMLALVIYALQIGVYWMSLMQYVRSIFVNFSGGICLMISLGSFQLNNILVEFNFILKFKCYMLVSSNMPNQRFKMIRCEQTELAQLLSTILYVFVLSVCWMYKTINVSIKQFAAPDSCP